MSVLEVFDAGAVLARLAPGAAVDALESAPNDGLDPEADLPRTSARTAAGELLLMPSTAGRAVGVKLASVAPGNPARGLPRVGGVYVLFDPDTLAAVAILDSAALTVRRTAAVSALALRHLSDPDGPARLLVYGTGPQAWAHVQAFASERSLSRVDVAGRDPGRLARFVERCRATGLDAGPAGHEALEAADVVCCATTARRPLFDGTRVAAHATVIAVGSHEPAAQEVDEGLTGRAWVVVEAVSAALREAGEVIAAVEAGALAPSALHPLSALVRGAARPPTGAPRLFKSTGMAWEDAVLAAAVVAGADGSPSSR